MADIKTYLAKIKEAIYGEEVRGSIHDALVVINRESEAAKTSAAESADNAAKVLNNTKDVAEAAQTAAAAANEAAEAAMDYVLGDISEKTVTFETAAQRAGIESGDSLSVAFGKLAKFCADLDQHAFNPLANNLTTNTAGYGMDARQGPVIDKKISDVQTSVDELNTNFEKKAYSYIVSTSSQYENAIAANTWTEVGKANIHVPEDGYYEICAKVIASGTSATTGVCTARLKRDGSEPGINSRSSFPIKSGLMTNTTCITVEWLQAGNHVLITEVYADSAIGAGYCSYFIKAF